MDECYEFALLFRFVFLNIGRGDVCCVVVGFVVLSLLYKHGGYPVFCYEMEFFFYLLSLFGCSWLTISVCDLCAFF